MNRLVWNCVLPSETVVGSGTVFGYRGLGTVVHPRAEIGDGCLIGPNVTIGGRSGLHGVPVVGTRVLVGAGARVLGPIVVGDGAVVGANAVVVQDVPARTVVVGVPAVVIKADVDVDDYATMPSAKE
jgi:serine O-acetyltransferase